MLTHFGYIINDIVNLNGIVDLHFAIKSSQGGGAMVNESYISARVTALRLDKGVSEYQMSMDLGKSKGYIQQISSGRSMPSVSELLKICEYFEITPHEFFDDKINNPALVRKAFESLKMLPDDDILMLLGIINRLTRE